MTVLAQGPNWTEVLNTVGSTAVVVLILGFLGRSLVKAWLNQNLENHKSALARQSQHELEHLRLSLRIEEMKQSRLLARQAKIMAKVYSRLERLHEAVSNLASPLQSGSDNFSVLRDKAIAEFNAFGAYYFPRAIWLDVETVNAINDMQSKLRKLLINFHVNLDAQGNVQDAVAWIESYKEVKEEIPKARGLLDKRFRSLLGVGEPVVDGRVGPLERL